MQLEDPPQGSQPGVPYLSMLIDAIIDTANRARERWHERNQPIMTTEMRSWTDEERAAALRDAEETYKALLDAIAKHDCAVALLDRMHVVWTYGMPPDRRHATPTYDYRDALHQRHRG